MTAGPRRKNAEEEEGRRKNKEREVWIRSTSRKWTKLIMIKFILSCEYMIAIFFSVITYI